MQKSTMATPPPPPPPPSQPTSAPKVNRKTMIALGIIVIIVVAIVVGVILATRGGGGGGGTGGNVADASSLQFSADVTSGGTLTTYTYSAKNIGTSNAMLRIEWTGDEGNTIYIVNGAQKQVWIYTDGEWSNFSDYFSDYWGEWNSTFSGFSNTHASHWSGSGDSTYTDPSTGDTVRFYSISVNPSLADSLFQHS